ncbi:Lactose operon repressor [Klebsiella pneumoniae]|nr:Lactose operon repressor [Klebsiella pneumoniae]
MSQSMPVSYQTVSRVVNCASHVSAKTREKVEAAMAQLNYIPNRVAQQLAGKQSLLIGVATSSLALHAPSQIVAAIKSRADQLRQRGGVDGRTKQRRSL